MNAPISAELVRRCQGRRLCSTTTAACAVLGAAIDAGIISLADLLCLVRSCDNADQLGSMLLMLATTATAQDWPPVGCPPGHEHRDFLVLGDGGA